ncbi:MAG: HAD family phosphatase [Clostridia bacterium]|nr:HAD family phosphatase [Clostridia bacterium]
MILFDLDGTLIDSNGIWEDIDLQFLGRHGLVPTEEYAHTVGHSIFPVAAQFTRDYYHLSMTPAEIMAEWMAGARDAYGTVSMKEGALEFLRECRARGERMAMVTACVRELCVTALSRHALEPYFEDVIFAEEMGLEKRNPEVFRRSAARLGVAPETCTLYEDAPANCAAAKTIGMKVVGVYDPFYQKYADEMRETCDRYIMSFSELI